VQSRDKADSECVLYVWVECQAAKCIANKHTLSLNCIVSTDKL